MIIILCTAVAVVLAVVMILSFAGKDAKNDIAEQKTENADNSASKQDANAVEENNGNEEKKTENVPAQEESSAVPVQTEEVKANPEEEVKVNPTFMYFVDNAQETETAAMIEELKAAYPDVVFDIKNVEKDPEILNNFELVKGNTPALIMLDTSNNICGFQFACADKALLEQSIKTALGE